MNIQRLKIGNALDVQDSLPIGSLTEANGFLYTYGLIPISHENGKVETESLEDQTRCIIDNLKLMLATRDKTLDDLVMVQIFLSNIKRDFVAFNAVYEEYFSSNPPTRYCVGAELAPFDGPPLLVEIHAIAAL